MNSEDLRADFCSEIEHVLDRLERYHQHRPVKIESGLTDLDRVCNGLPRSKLIMLAGYTDAGRTGFCLNILRRLCLVQNKTGVVFATSTEREDLIQRILCLDIGISRFQLSEDCSPCDLSKLGLSSQALQNSQLFIYDNVADIADIKSRVQHISRSTTPDLIIIDDVHGMLRNGLPISSAFDERLMALELKRLARELDCPLIAVSRLFRSSNQITKRWPVLNDMRDWGEWEEIADLVWLMNRPGLSVAQRGPLEDVEVLVAKNGSTGIRCLVEISFDAKLGRFLNKERLIECRDRETDMQCHVCGSAC